MDMLDLFASSLFFLFVTALIFMPLELVFFANKVAKPKLGDIVLYWFYPTIGIWLAGIVLFKSVGLIQPFLPVEWLHWIKSQALWVQLAGAILFGELWFYLMHRAFHYSQFLWQFHRMHHSIKTMSWSAAFREHPVDFLFVVMGANIPAMIFGISLQPIALFIALERLHTILVHSNVSFDFGWLGKWVVVSPQYHRLHHSQGRVNCNYAGMFVLFDRIGRTYRV